MLKYFSILLLVTTFVFAGSKNQFYYSSASLQNPNYSWQNQSQIRAFIDLNGEWEYRAARNQPWQKAIVPSAYDFTGLLTFRKFFLVETNHAGHHFRFTALAINYSCTIKINQQYVGNHQGGNTSFTMEIPDGILRIGESNVIEIEVDNRLNSFETIPLTPQAWEWENFGGIFRELFIESVPSIYIDRYQIKQQLDVRSDRADLIFTLKIRNLSGFSETGKPLNCEAELRDPENLRSTHASVSINPLEGIQQVTFSLILKSPNLWSPENPVLYHVKLQLSSGKKVFDEIRFPIGIREFKVRGNEFILNGNPFIYKGVTYYENYERSASVTDYDLLEKDIRQIKTLGANALRLTQYPAHPFLLKLCDEIGLVILQELPILNVPAHHLSQRHFLETAKKYAEEMILRDQHHGSIVSWGIGTDFDTAHPDTRRFVNEMVLFIRKLDSRPVYYSTRMVSNDLCLDLPDFVGVNLYTSSIDDFSAKINYWEKKYIQKPLVITRYGIDIFPMNRLGTGDPTSEDYQAKYFLEAYQILRRKNPLGGSFIESFSDWKRAKPNINNNPEDDPYMARYGLTDQGRNERPAFAMVRALYLNDKLPNILETNPVSSSQAIFVLSGVALFFLTSYWYRRNGRFRDNLFRALRHPFGFFSDIRDHRVIPMPHTIMMGLIVAGVISLFFTDFIFLNRRNSFFDFVVNHFIIQDAQKIFFKTLVWHPVLMSVVFLIFQLIGILVIMALWILLTFPISRRMDFLQAVHIGVWSGAHYLVLVPVTIFLYPILQNSNWHLYLGIFVLFLLAIHLNRLFLGIRLASYMSFRRMFFVSGFFVVGITTGILYYYHHYHASGYYFQFLIHLIQGNQIPT